MCVTVGPHYNTILISVENVINEISEAKLCVCFGMGGIRLPYFFGYMTEFFSFQNNIKDLDPSCKMDLDLWGCLRRVKLVL